MLDAANGDVVVCEFVLPLRLLETLVTISVTFYVAPESSLV